jgi:signal transduction histidine kinase
VREQRFEEGNLAAGLPPTHPRQGSFLGVPITSAGKVYGILYVIGKLGEKPFSDEDECLAASLAAQIGSAYRNVLQYEQLKAANTLLKQEVAQRQRAEEELRESTALLHILSHRLMAAQESERRSLARELHDGIGQAMSTLGLNLHILKGACSAEVKATCINDSVGIVAQTLQQVRDLSLGLRPSVLDDLGLIPALEWQLNMLARSAGIQAEISAEPFVRRVPPELETACFRVAQEALTNVVRHAGARRVSLEVCQTDRDLILAVRDDGVGFDVGAAARKARGGSSMGLLSMQERVSLAHGEFHLQSTPGSGTRIRARFPLTDLPAPAESHRSIAS